VPGLGTSYGRGGATTNQMDVRFADSVLIMGSNMAECHPVSFRFVMQAKLNGAKVIHADPRFTRTSAMADVYAPLRAGTDIVFLGGLIRYVLEKQRYFQEYVSAYTNAATLITEEFQGTEDLEGLFSGFDAERKEYDPKSWRYDAEPAGRPGNQPVRDLNDASTFSARGGRLTRPPRTDPTLQHPRCVFQILRRHLFTLHAGNGRARLRDAAGDVPQGGRDAVPGLGPRADRRDLLRGRLDPAHHGRSDNSRGHDPAVAPGQYRPARGRHPRPARPRLDPGFDRYPHALQPAARLSNTPSALKNHDTLADYIETEISPTSYWYHFFKFIVSLLTAWFGAAATRENDYGFGWLPRNVGDHSHLPMFVAMSGRSAILSELFIARTSIVVRLLPDPSQRGSASIQPEKSRFM